jgi:hypothetical protein
MFLGTSFKLKEPGTMLGRNPTGNHFAGVHTTLQVRKKKYLNNNLRNEKNRRKYYGNKIQSTMA